MKCEEILLAASFKFESNSADLGDSKTFLGRPSLDRVPVPRNTEKWIMIWGPSPLLLGDAAYS